ncbi:fumarylacetoacetate hydrolase family protein [Pigmentiphaga sp. YJ18]|uniref:fumarylacetoacetate hydrolase family protein n=1 Tax=Pigmentiphaga sp. YJ18 TaxID=3134907 RepID=UPI00310EECBA
MKIAKYGSGRIAAVVGERLVDLNRARSAQLRGADKGEVPADLLDFIKAGPAALDAAYAALNFVLAEGPAPRATADGPLVMDLAATPLLAPLPSLGSKLICMGRNFAGHSKAAQKANAERAAAGDTRPQMPASAQIPKRPAGFIKFADTVVGPDEPVLYPSRTRKLDYEVEIALIIGAQGKDIPREQALRHAFGYTVFCDYSARDQNSDLEDMNWVRHHKNFDCAASMGPWIVTADEGLDPHDVAIRTWVNGELRQDGTTADMIHDFARIIEYYSVDQTLYPGDLFASGTCEGTGMEKKDGSWFLQPGDRIEFEIPRIGRYGNPIVAKPPAGSPA